MRALTDDAMRSVPPCRSGVGDTGRRRLRRQLLHSTRVRGRGWQNALNGDSNRNLFSLDVCFIGTPYVCLPLILCSHHSYPSIVSEIYDVTINEGVETLPNEQAVLSKG